MLILIAYPVCSPSWENVADDGPAVSAATDAKAKPVAVIGQHNHLDLSPVTLKLKKQEYMTLLKLCW